jgi:hypothetical protein
MQSEHGVVKAKKAGKGTKEGGTKENVVTA